VLVPSAALPSGRRSASSAWGSSPLLNPTEQGQANLAENIFLEVEKKLAKLSASEFLPQAIL